MESFLLLLQVHRESGLDEGRGDPSFGAARRTRKPRWIVLFLAAWAALLPGAAQIPNQGQGILREFYAGIPGSTLFELTNAPSFPGRPTSTNVIRDFFEAPSDAEDNYGQRLRGFVVPPITGNYVFWIASDDQSALFLSTNDDPSRRVQIAGVEFWTSFREWDSEPGQQSPALRLEAGQRYYIEALMKEGEGGDHLSVRWQLPDGNIEEPIPGTRLLPFGSAIVPPRIRTQPADVTVTEGESAVFRVDLRNLTPAAYQWERERNAIEGATRPVYTNLISSLADNGARFRVVITNAEGSATSSEAVLRVLPDLTPPSLRLVVNVGTDRLRLQFSEPVLGASRVSSYALGQGATVLSAAYGDDTKTVILTTSPLALRSTYALRVSGVTDAAEARNPIASGTAFDFSVIELSPNEIGAITGASSILAASGGFTVTAAGRGIGGIADEFLFSQQERVGDFDVQVRVESLGLTDPWAKAGLVARETLDPQSRFAAALTTPGANGSVFAFRPATGATAQFEGFYPANFPETWLRLSRSGQQFTGYASLDGHSWSVLGHANLQMTNRIFLGLGLTSQNTNQAVVAQFRGFQPVTDPVPEGATFTSSRETPGPSSRNTGLVITEIMYHPAPRADGLVGEFVELYNSGPVPVDLGGHRLAGSIDFTFPEGTTLAAGAYKVVAPRPDDLRIVYGFSQALGGFDTRLNDRAGEVRLLNRRGAILLEARYGSQPPYPAAADGTGHSLVLSHPSYGERDPRAWSASDLIGGSPGAGEVERRTDWHQVKINEVLAHTDAPQLDFIELHNHGSKSVDLDGAILTDTPGVARYRIPQGTRLSPGGFAVFTQDLLGFALNAAGESIFLYTPGLGRVVDSVKFGPQLNGVSSGRFPNGSENWTLLAAPTPASSNASRRISEVVLNEIHYHPLSGDRRETFVELHNPGADPVNLAGWRIEDDIDFTFPAGSLLEGGGFLAVAKDAAYLKSIHPHLTNNPVLGNFSGSLSFGGARVTLSRPEEIVGTNNAGRWTTNRVFVAVESVDYRGGGRWSTVADGGGSSLERLDPRADPAAPSSWSASDERNRGAWTLVTRTGVLDNTSSAFQADTVQVLLMGEGECLVDNVEVFTADQQNLVSNGNFEAGLTSWTLRGTHATSEISPEGYKSAKSLKLIASARGDTGPNQVVARLRSAVPVGATATVRAQVRWLRGNPEILVRLHGNGLEAAGRMNVPAGAGTPAASNSRSFPNLGPAISNVRHHPVLPGAGEPVRISARITDPDNVGSVRLLYRLDPAITVLSTNLFDNGTHGDEVPGDGVYSVTLPGQAAGVVMAFSIEATDGATGRAKSIFPADAPKRECLVMFGGERPPGGLGNYHVWITQATEDLWVARGGGSNDSFDATFVDGNGRIVYNIRALYSGSPFHWRGYNGPLGGNCNYLLQFPEDDRYLGSGDFVLNSPANLGGDSTAQRELTFYWMIGQLDQPVTHRRQHRLFVNGRQRGNPASDYLFEDAQQPNGEFLSTWFPSDSNGELYKIEDWFEYAEDGFNFRNVDASLESFLTTGGAKKLERYRWAWRKRSVNSGESAHDYTQLFELVDAVNEPSAEAYTSRVENLVDVSQWMTAIAMRHVVGDWDAYGYRRGKNMYAYKPERGAWQLLHWDIAFAFGQGDGPSTDLFASIEPMIRRMFQHPPFRRLYLQALQRAVDGPLDPDALAKVVDARYSSLAGGGLAIASPTAIKSYAQSRRAFIVQTLSSNQAPFAVTSLPSETTTNRSLIEISGTAPIRAREILINGVSHPLRWTAVNRWSLTAVLNPGTNRLTLTTRGLDGRVDSENQIALSILKHGPDDSSALGPVINEIQWDDTAPGGEFIELFNPSSTRAFDISGWKIQGAGAILSDGAFIRPLGFVVIPRDAFAMRSAFGNDLPIAGTLGAKLSRSGQVLRLTRAASVTGGEELVDLARYETAYPWPASQTAGASIQRVASDAPGVRPLAWAAVDNQATLSSEWNYVSISGAPTGSRFMLQLDAEGEVLVDDFNFVEGPVPAVGPNLITNPGFESAGVWTFDPAYAGSAVVNTDPIEGAKALRVSAAGPLNETQGVRQTLAAPLIAGRVYTFSFWYKPLRGGKRLHVRFEDSPFAVNVELAQSSLALSTPGAPNNLDRTVSAVPAVALNEILPVNVAGIADASGALHGWVEIANTGTSPIPLQDFFLKFTESSRSTNAPAQSTNLAWPFPATVLNPGEFRVVWFGGASPGNLHSTLTAPTTGGRLLLGRRESSGEEILDLLDFPTLPADQSFGRIPDGDPLAVAPLASPSPGRSNRETVRQPGVVINEWMASNTRTLADPADGDFEDWIELHNPTLTAVDLSGYHLSDVLTNATKWMIPPGTILAPGAFLLVWADEETGQNGAGRDLHVNFKLSAQGEEIGLFAPNGTLVDAVRFGAQTADVSQGRFPDAAPEPYRSFPIATPRGANRIAPPSEGLRILEIRVEGSLVTLRFQSEPGRRYRLESAESVQGTPWQSFGVAETATTDRSTLRDARGFGAGRQRFYRVARE